MAQDSKQPTCQICKEAEAIYNCPKCGVRTCSLTCTKGHRQEAACNGKRSRTDFVKVGDFDERQLLADIRLMEEVGREADAAARREPQKAPERLPPILQELRREAGKRNVSLEFLSPGMQKRMQNSSYHERKRKRLLWHLNWNFVAANLHIQQRRVPEDSCLGNVLQEHVKPQKRGFKDDEKMQPYTEVGLEELTVLMRPARTRVNNVRYHKLDLSQTLASQLEHKTIIEFPDLLVLLPGHKLDYKLVGEESSGADESSSGEYETTSSEEESA